MDGRPHPKDLEPSYYGHSVGRWEGDALVIDTVGFNERSWIDLRGMPTTEQLHLTERITRPDFNTLRYEITIDDPGAYTAPWSTGMFFRWAAGAEQFEFVCQDGNLAPSPDDWRGERERSIAAAGSHRRRGDGDARSSGLCLMCVWACLAIDDRLAQEGHPLIGTWSGDWGPSPALRSSGPDRPGVEYDHAQRRHQPGRSRRSADQGRHARFDEVDASPRSRTPRTNAANLVKIVADGKLENIGSHNRTLTGTWTRGNIKGNFKLTRE